VTARGKCPFGGEPARRWLLPKGYSRHPGEPAGGLGYVSGHSAAAVALATVASPYLGRRSRRVAWALALAVWPTIRPGWWTLRRFRA
jgi:membrane-associated phospholipid phosphatase